MTSYAALEAAEEQGVITIAGHVADAEVRVAHPLYGEVIRAQLPVVRGRAHRLQLAEVIQQRRPMTADDALRIARWLISAGAEIPGELLVDAAEAANVAGDPRLGADLARRAINAGGGLRPVLILSRAYSSRNRFEDAEEVLAAAEPTVAGDPHAYEYLEHRSYVLSWALRREEETMALLERAMRWSDDPAWVARIKPFMTAMAALSGRPERQLDAIRAVVDGPEHSPEMRSSMRVTLVVALLAAGQMREANARVRELRPRPPLRRHIDAYALGTTSLAAEDGSAEWREIRTYMRQTLRDAVRIADHQAASFAALTLAALDVRRGRYRDSERWLTETEIQLEQHDGFDLLTNVTALRSGIAYFTGDPAAAQTALETVRRRLEGRTPHLGQVVYVACAEGWAARALGDKAGADTFLAQADAIENLGTRSRLLHEALRAGARADRIAPKLTELAARGDSEAFEARAAHATALAEHDATGLLAASEQLDRIGCTAAAVDACLAAARQLLDEGRRDSARRAALRARELHPADQGWELPAIDGLDGVAVQLTAREAQIAALAAQGLSSPEIAEQLVLSVRTVETYVYRAMQKRGVTNRADL